jgi:ABC-type antimicrobial peptide transport system permease subunit
LGGETRAASYLDDLLFGISPRDSFAYGLVVGGVAIVGLLANAVPAQRAAVLDPMRALRTE